MNNEAIQQIIDGMIEMSGNILFHVTGTWAQNGRTGNIDHIIVARNAVEAMKRAWATESDGDLRTIQVKWLCPIESVLKCDDSRLTPDPE